MDYYVLTPISFLFRVLEVFSQFTFALVLIGVKVFNKKHFAGQ